MTAEESPDWLVKLYEEQGITLHRLVVLLGVEDASGRIVRSAMLALHRRGNRLIDPGERVEFIAEHAVHLARASRTVTSQLTLPAVAEARQNDILRGIASLPPRMAEILVVSHYLSVFGPELAAIMRMSVRGCNQKLEISLETLRAKVGAAAAGGQPGSLESFSQEVTAALRASARQVQAPGTVTLEGELAQLSGQYRRHLAPRFVVLLTIIAILLGLLLAVLTRPQPTPAVLSQPTASPAPSVTASRTLPAQVRNIAVYYVGRSDGLLHRELRDLPSAENLLNSVVEAVLTLVPLDPDYRSSWGPGQVLSVESAGDTVTIDLSTEAYAELTTDELAVQARNQMVFSVNALVGDADNAVFFLQDGAAPPDVFASEEGYTSLNAGVLAPLQISTPRNQAQLSVGRTSITGTVREGASSPIVQVTDVDSGAVLATLEAELTGATGDDGQKGWATAVSLGAGNYEVRVTTSWGTPPVEFLENKSIRIT